MTTKKSQTKKTPAKKPAAKKATPSAKARTGAPTRTKAAPRKKAPGAGLKPRSKKSAALKKPAAKKPPRAVKPSAKAGPAENPEALAMARKIAQLVLDKKASDVVILDVRGHASYADYLVLASGESERQVSAMADGVEDNLRKEGTRPVSSEGHETGQWVLIDYGDVVAHLFHTEARGFYDLEWLWADAKREPVS
jgi:ribosome-associated protein